MKNMHMLTTAKTTFSPDRGITIPVTCTTTLNIAITFSSGMVNGMNRARFAESKTAMTNAGILVNDRTCVTILSFFNCWANRMVSDKNHRAKNICLIRPGTGGRNPMKTFPRKYAGMPATSVSIIRIKLLSLLNTSVVCNYRPKSG